MSATWRTSQKIDYAYDADAYFPNLDERPEWKITADSEEQTYFDLGIIFTGTRG